MKKIWITMSLPLIVFCSFGQINLVPNPSFEDTVQCPNHGGNIDQAIGWINCGITPDYYNSCANITFPGLGVPNGLYTGYQNALDGNAYGAFYTYQCPLIEHEFIATQLSQPMIIGVKYYTSCYISRSDNYVCATNNFGFRFFTNISFSTANAAPIDNFSHIHSDSVISDSVNWTKITGSFVADSAYQFVVIGNFYDNAHTNTFNCDTNGVDASYYLIDKVCISNDSITCNTWTGIKEVVPNQILVYPNPIDEVLFLSNVVVSMKYTIFNSTGEVIKSGVVTNQNNEINISSIKTGIYLLSIDNKVFHKFLVIH